MLDGGTHADAIGIQNLVAHSHYLVDSGRWDELADASFAIELDGIVPEADFGFACWRGTEGIRAGYRASMPRFEAAVHVVSNLRLRLFDGHALAQYYVQGWHWTVERS